MATALLNVNSSLTDTLTAVTQSAEESVMIDCQLGEATHTPAIARTAGNRMRAVHSLLTYLVTELPFTVTTNQSAVPATSWKGSGQNAYR